MTRRGVGNEHITARRASNALSHKCLRKHGPEKEIRAGGKDYV